MGTFVYPITFTLRDVVHKVLGRHLARTLIVATAGVNLFLAAYLLFTDQVESDPRGDSATSGTASSARCGAS